MEKIQTIAIGVIGVGYLGNFHLKQLSKIKNVKVSGLYDKDKTQAKKISSQYNVTSFETLEDLLTCSDAISIVTPTKTHYSIADLALDYNCHIFIEKPITDNINDAKKILTKAKKINKIIQVGHIERFNPAFNKLKKMKINPQFIESHRLSKYNIRGSDVPVILDLMIHDIDIILSLVSSNIIDIHANGVKVISNSIDIANARIQFENGCVANITSSRISQKNMRKMRLFQKQDYLSIDFKKQIIEEYEVTKNKPSDSKILLELEKQKYICYRKPHIIEYDALKKELSHFIGSILQSKQPETDGESATRALEIAIEIQKIIDK